MSPNRSALIIITTLALASVISAIEVEKFPPIEFKPLSPATQLKDTEIGSAITTILDSCDRVEAKLIPAKGTKREPTMPVDQSVITPLKASLGVALYEKKDYCFCVSYPSYSFYKGDRCLMTLSFPHGHKIRISGGSLSGDYEVGEDVVQKVTSILTSSK